MSAVLASVHDVHTSEPDLFGTLPAAVPRDPSASCSLRFTGRLSHKPHVAMRQIDTEGHLVPVLVLELADVGAGHHDIVAHIPYTAANRDQAEAQAKRLRRDQVVTVTTELLDIRVLLRAASLSLSHDQP